MRPNCRSRGAATEVDMVSGSAPGRAALTAMVGKSTGGSGETGGSRKASPPASTIPTVRRVVATGRFMNGAEMFMGLFVSPPRQPVKGQVDDRSGVEGEDLAEDQAANDGDPQGAPQLG